MKIREYKERKEELLERISSLLASCEEEMGYEFQKWSDTLPVLQNAFPEITSVKKTGKVIVLGIEGENWKSKWKVTPDKITCDDMFEEDKETEEADTTEEVVTEESVVETVIEETADTADEENEELPELEGDCNMVLEKGVLYRIENGNKVKSSINCIKKTDEMKVYMKKTENERFIYVGYVEDGKVVSFVVPASTTLKDIFERIEK